VEHVDKDLEHGLINDLGTRSGYHNDTSASIGVHLFLNENADAAVNSTRIAAKRCPATQNVTLPAGPEVGRRSGAIEARIDFACDILLKSRHHGPLLAKLS
jgi:hypothetical protein